MELMTEYSEEGCFARVFYPTNIPSDQLDVSIKVSLFINTILYHIINPIYISPNASAIDINY
jgi:hypothetical protein